MLNSPNGYVLNGGGNPGLVEMSKKKMWTINMIKTTIHVSMYIVHVSQNQYTTVKLVHVLKGAY